MQIYNQHLTVHGIDSPVFTKRFVDKNAFQSFKLEMENEKNSFVTRTSRDDIALLRCYRSKAYRDSKLTPDSEKDGKLNEYKLQQDCPAFMKAEYDNNGTVNVTYSKFHIHEDLFMLKLTKQVKNSIKVKLSIGISQDNILKQVRTEFPNFLIEHKDILNIVDQLNTDEKNDKVSSSNSSHQN